MVSAQKSKSVEIVASWEDFQAMRRDHTMVVVMALPTSVEGMFNITFWSKEDGELPTWIIDRNAA